MSFKVIYILAQTLLRVFFRVCFNPKIQGKDNLIKDEGFVFSGNHKSNFDPLLLAAYLPKKINFLAKKELFSNRLLGWFLSGLGIIPITRNNVETGTLKKIIKLLRSRGSILIFPQGTRKNTDVEKVKSGAVLFAIKGQVPIQPALITGEYKPSGNLKIIFGKPIYYTEYYNQKVTQQQLHQLSVELMRHIYSLSGEGDDSSNANSVS
ncbi:MAG: 1-acyl-sn-glycerol-3-phosphate acyltransferase [Clostridiaceae bacterium]|nr:1-acyl-sn-glycerol-3-phosphate acyltransferase [Clostridiaceae bacterium]